MKKRNPLIVVLVINAVILLIAYFISGSSGNENLAVTGLTSLFLCPVELLIGILLAIFGDPNSDVRKYGQAFMLASVFMLLCGFSLCSQA